MTSQGRILPKDVVDHWPEVFGDIKLNVLPISYLNAVLVNFKDGKTWEIRVTPQTRKAGWESFEKSLSELVIFETLSCLSNLQSLCLINRQKHILVISIESLSILCSSLL